ncbi:MAG: hypothetical protein H0V89_10555 [Deltaproteobacteria bacterium]|nr:hypothetical protein [Deltaproteobacteria bacterium]
MALQYAFPISSSQPDIVRNFFTSFPLDWYDQVLNLGSLPVVAFLHGGDQSADDFMFGVGRIQEWWEGAFQGTQVKACAYAPQGASLNGKGAWNAGIMGTIARLSGVDDVSFFFDGLNRFEQYLLDWYANVIQPVTSGGAITAVFDRNRLMLVGFSEGGQMAYRLAAVAAANGWTVSAMCVFGSSIGGWYRQVDFNPGGLAANVVWTVSPVPSLFHVHGNFDTFVNPVADGWSPQVQAAATAQVPLTPSDYATADISGQNSAGLYVTLANAIPGWAAVGGAAPPASIPAGVAGLSAFTTNNWDSTGGAVADRQVCFARVGGGMAHVVPAWGPDTMVEFFLTWGGL